jgi:dihydroorotate dehydrogenase
MNTLIGGVKMSLPIMVGAGVCKTPASVLPYMRKDASVGAVITGSYTPEERRGNEGVVFWPEEITQADFRFALNSYGMPNAGFTRTREDLLESRAKYVHPLVVSIAGFSLLDYARGIELFGNNADYCPAAIELNLGCPNTQDKKPLPMSYDLEDMRKLFQLLASRWFNCPIWVKFSPYLMKVDLQNFSQEVDATHVPVVDLGYMMEVCDLVLKFQGSIKAVVTANTVPSCIYRINGKPVTDPFEGKAGLSGPLLRKIAMNQTRFFADAFAGTSVDVIHAGGITHGDHVVQALEAGAKGVQCVTFPFMYGGPKAFSELIAGSEKLQEYLSSTVTEE